MEGLCTFETGPLMQCKPIKASHCTFSFMFFFSFLKLNGFPGKMMVDLDSAVSQLESWKTAKGLLIMGVENNFCSGGDLDFAEKTATAEGGYKMAKFMQNILIRLQQLPLISVAFIEGFGKLNFCL